MNNFRNYQRLRVKEHIKTVIDALNKIKRQKRFFTSLNDLATTLSDITNIHKNTLLYRNPYKKILLIYFNKINDSNNLQTKNINDLHFEINILNSKINLQNQIIKKKSEEILKLQKIIHNGLKFSPNHQLHNNIDELQSANTALLSLISNILNNHQKMLTYDTLTMSLIDRSRRQGDPSRNLISKDEFAIIAKHFNSANPQSLNNIFLDNDAIINEKF